MGAGASVVGEGGPQKEESKAETPADGAAPTIEGPGRSASAKKHSIGFKGRYDVPIEVLRVSVNKYVL